MPVKRVKRKAVPRLSDFSIKGYKTFRGMEGYGYNATILLRGQPVALAMDDATGGEIRIEWTNGKRWDPPQDVVKFLESPEAVALAVKKEEEFRKKYNFKTGEPLPTKLSAEELVEHLVSAHEEKKHIEKLAKKHGFLFRPVNAPEGEYSFYKLPKGYQWTKEKLEKLEAQAKKENGEIVVLARPEVTV